MLGLCLVLQYCVSFLVLQSRELVALFLLVPWIGCGISRSNSLTF